MAINPFEAEKLEAKRERVYKDSVRRWTPRRHLGESLICVVVEKQSFALLKRSYYKTIVRYPGTDANGPFRPGEYMIIKTYKNLDNLPTNVPIRVFVNVAGLFIGFSWHHAKPLTRGA